MSDSWPRNAIAITGIVGSGKSTVARLLSELGGFVLSADEQAREVVAPGTPGLAQIAEEFGPGVLNPDGSVNRPALGEIVFSDAAKRKRLNEITHPLIGHLTAKRFTDAAAQGRSPLFYDCPLFFEAGLDKRGFKKVILVTASDETIINRLMKDRGWSREEAEKRVRSQIPLHEKKEKSDIVIENEGSLEELKEKVKEVWENIR